MENKTSWLLIFTFSPVQSFISSAKKTKDLFAGSYLLSFLTKMVLTELEKQLKEELIRIYPQLEKKEEDFFSFMVGNYPNRFVVILKNKTQDDVRKIIKTLKYLFHKELQELAGNTCNLFVEKALEGAEKYSSKVENIPYLKKAVEQLMKHIEDYFSSFVVAKPVRLCQEGNKLEIADYQREYEITEKLLGGRKTFRPYKGKVDNATFDGEKYPDGCTTCGERLHLAINWQKARIDNVGEEEKLCGLCYAKRNLYEVYLKNRLQKGEDKEIKLLMTRFPSTHDIALAREKYEFFETLYKIYQDRDALQKFLNKVEDITFLIWDIAKLIRLFASEGAKSYGINPFYRKSLENLAEKILPTEKDLGKFLKERKETNLDRYKEDLKTPWSISVEYLSTAYIEELLRYLKNKTKEIEEAKEKIEFLKNWLNILRRYFNAIKDVTGKDFELEFNKPPYFAIIYSDGDNIGKILGGEREFLKQGLEFNLEFHQKFSEKLSEYALETSKEIEKPSDKEVGFAKVIYAGGDDIFAFLHGSEVIRALKVCSKNYKEKLKCLLNEEKATTSAGVVLGHAKVSLKYIHEKVKEAESRAKKVFGRNAFVIKVISRSGEESEFGAKYRYCSSGEEISTLDLLEEITKGYSEGYISSKLPYTLRDIADRFFPSPKDEKDNENEKRNIAKALLKRELLRKIDSNYGKKDEIIQKVLELFKVQFEEHELEVNKALKNIAGMFYVARKLSDYYRRL